MMQKMMVQGWRLSKPSDARNEISTTWVRGKTTFVIAFDFSDQGAFIAKLLDESR